MNKAESHLLVWLHVYVPSEQNGCFPLRENAAFAHSNSKWAVNTGLALKQAYEEKHKSILN